MMKIYGLLVFVAFLYTPAKLENGRCSACVHWGVTSIVKMDGMASCTAMASPSPYYDEQGKLHIPPDPNVCTWVGHCSRGHVVVERTGGSNR
jgi:hypothetical protein